MTADIRQTELKKKLFLEELEKDDFGNIVVVCKKLGIGRTTCWEWRQKDKEFSDRVNELVISGRKSMVGLAEHKLASNISKGKEASIIFALKTLGKDVGYIERKEVTGADGKDIIPDMSKMTAEELMALADKLTKKED